MSPHDNEPLPEIPEMVPDRDDLASYHRQKQIKPKTKERIDDSNSGSVEKKSGSGALTYVFGVLAIVAVGWAGYLHMQLINATDRVAALEDRLSSTDESVNQSSVALQVKIKDVDAALTQVRDETLKKMKAQIDQQTTQIAGLDKTAKNTQASVAGVDQKVAEQGKEIEGARAQIDKLAAVVDTHKQKADQQQASIDAVSNKVKSVSDSQAKLDSRLSNNEEWVDSINTFRKQMNREIVNIKQQIAGGKPAPAPAEIQ
jgi:methyl-accepting chemotaxis protein